MSESAEHFVARSYPSEAWGTYRGDALTRLLIRTCRAIPRAPIVKQLVFPIRKFARSRLNGPIDHHLWGHRLRFRPNGNIAEGRLLFLPERWDPSERAALTQRLRPGDTFVDVGANFGGYTWWALSRLGRRIRVIAFEPDPELYQGLRFNLQSNGFEDVSVLPIAVGTEVGTFELHVSLENRGQNSLIRPEEGSYQSRTVAVRPLAALLDEQEVRRVDAMKIDIEGMEPAVLDRFLGEAPRTVWPRLLICERKETAEHQALVDRLEAEGYRVVRTTRLNLVAELREGR